MNLLVRADASIAMGTGHVMRCLALAQAWREAGGDAAFVMAQSTPAIEALLTAESYPVNRLAHTAPGTIEGSQSTIELARDLRAKWIIVDGYQFGSEYLGALKAAGFKVLFIDDYGHAGHYAADLVLNQNSYAQESLYESREPYTRLLLGTKYCLLRREFAQWRDWRREIPAVGRKILLTMGGSDPKNVTGLVINALAKLRGIEVIVVVGGSNPHFDPLRTAASRAESNVDVRKDVRNMPELMAWADVAVAGAGSTCWEMCLLKLPMVLIDLADNQKPIARSLELTGAGIYVGSAQSVEAEEIARRVEILLSSQKERECLSAACGKLVDGLGARRVVSELKQH
ncbi:MAG TPA: UDP-2,4-diacetamido-2,4,6-trideoxy-beta-L-altropyranose hydrolase [Candidatus Solibacter sp.]|nr:UDP-2,4-diacetamido-2,4,6-trideoxy-beta-L-altropyranose hydrolase [Candidatus Solibacter sp.]